VSTSAWLDKKGELSLSRSLKETHIISNDRKEGEGSLTPRSPSALGDNNGGTYWGSVMCLRIR